MPLMPARCLGRRYQSCASRVTGTTRPSLTRWSSNKAPKNVASWIARPDHSLLVALEDGAILAVGAVTDTGEITLNYVSPDARFRGVSKTLLGALEVRAADRGNAQCTLASTETASLLSLRPATVRPVPRSFCSECTVTRCQSLCLCSRFRPKSRDALSRPKRIHYYRPRSLPRI